MTDSATKNSPSLYTTMASSCFSGMLSRIPCHPLDTAKARLQAISSISNMPHLTVRSSITSAFKNNGLRGVYAGFGMAFFGMSHGLLVRKMEMDNSLEIILDEFYILIYFLIFCHILQDLHQELSFTSRHMSMQRSFSQSHSHQVTTNLQNLRQTQSTLHLV